MSKNFATSTITGTAAAGVAPGLAGTSFGVQSGHGTRFYVGKAVVFPQGTSPDPSNAEVVSITAVVGDLLTVTRAQESSTGQSVGVGWVVQQGVTAGMWDGLVTGVSSVDGKTGAVSLTGTYVPLALPTTGMPFGSSESSTFRMRALAKKVAAIDSAVNHVRWLTFGSSVADCKIREIGPLLVRAYGGVQVGAIIGAWSTGGGLAASGITGITTNSTTGTAPAARTADFDVWPSGLTTSLQAAGSMTLGMGGGSPVCDNIEIYYVTGPASSL